MIKIVKEKIAAYVVKRELKKQARPEINFRNFFSNSLDFFVIMPDDEQDFLKSFEVLNFLENQRKTVRLFALDFKISLVPLKLRQHSISHGVKDVTKWNLPNREVQEKLGLLNFDVAIDLNRKDSLYHSLVTNLVKSSYRIGFAKNGSDRFYNLQVANVEDNAELSYKNLLNCLGMF